MSLATAHAAEVAGLMDDDEHAVTVTYNGTDISAIPGDLKRQIEEDGAMVDLLPLWVAVADVTTPAYWDTVIYNAETWRVQPGSTKAGAMWAMELKRDERPPL